MYACSMGTFHIAMMFFGMIFSVIGAAAAFWVCKNWWKWFIDIKIIKDFMIKIFSKKSRNALTRRDVIIITTWFLISGVTLFMDYLILSMVSAYIFGIWFILTKLKKEHFWLHLFAITSYATLMITASIVHEASLCIIGLMCLAVWYFISRSAYE